MDPWVRIPFIHELGISFMDPWVRISFIYELEQCSSMWDQSCSNSFSSQQSLLLSSLFWSNYARLAGSTALKLLLYTCHRHRSCCPFLLLLLLSSESVLFLGARRCLLVCMLLLLDLCSFGKPNLLFFSWLRGWLEWEQWWTGDLLFSFVSGDPGWSGLEETQVLVASLRDC